VFLHCASQQWGAQQDTLKATGGEKMSKTEIKPPTMHRLNHLLTQEDKAICCAQLREHSVRYSGAHLGLLPFIGIVDVHVVLQVAINKAKHEKKKPFRLAKLKETIDGFVPFKNGGHKLYLDGAKVGKYFGKYPERGRSFAWMHFVNTHAGMKSGPFGRGIVPNPISVKPVVALKYVKHGYWEVQCDEAHRHEVERWLCDNLR